MAYYVRKLPRLSGYDYSQNGYYFITVCTHQKRLLFGSIHKQAMMLSDIGTIIENELLQIPVRYDGVRIDAYTIMPNHLHCIIVIEKPEPFGKYPTLSEIVGLYKSGVTKQLHLSKPKMIIWQKSFFDRILRDDAAYLGVLRYIEENTRKWESDEYYG